MKYIIYVFAAVGISLVLLTWMLAQAYQITTNGDNSGDAGATAASDIDRIADELDPNTKPVSSVQSEYESPYMDKLGPLVLSEQDEPMNLKFVAPSALKPISANATNVECGDIYTSGTVRCVTLIADEDEGQTVLPTGERIFSMSFNGTIPSPTIRVTQGDIVKITIVNRGDQIHSIDLHGSQISAVPNFADIQVNQNKTFTFVAVNPGVWAYHCEANNVFGLDEHALDGMAGMTIIDPKEGYSEFVTDTVVPNAIDKNFQAERTLINGTAREFQFVYGEWYLADESTPHTATDGEEHMDHKWDKLKSIYKEPTYTHENGIPFAYVGPLLGLPPWYASTLSMVTGEPNLDGADPQLTALVNEGRVDGLPLSTLESAGPLTEPGAFATHLDVMKGDHARFFIQNLGNAQVDWHIVGEQLDRVTVGGTVMTSSPLQTWSIGAYEDATIDVVFEQPGVYAAVNHDYSKLFKGQAAIIVVHDPEINSEDCFPEEGQVDVVCLLLAGDRVENPSNAVPPMSALPDTSMNPGEVCTYGIGPDNEYGTEDDDTMVSGCSAA